MKYHPSMCSVLAFCILAACHGTDEVGSVGTVAQPQLELNQLELNQLGLRRLSLSQLQPGLHALEHTDLMESEDGRTVLRYVTICALSPGQELAFQHDGFDYRYNGHLGLAPSWLDNPLTRKQQRWMTACLLSLVNAYGVPVEVSLRADGVSSASPQEMADFPVYEATFFGNLFSNQPRLHACQGSRNPVANAHSDDRALRVCSDPTDDCAIEVVGPCNQVCDTHTGQYGASDCRANGRTFRQTFSVWLRDDNGDQGNGVCAPGTSCAFACTGASCQSGVFDCHDSVDCSATCGGGKVCTTDCTAANQCAAQCDGGLCDIGCVDSGSCSATCRGQSDCEIDCRGSADCADTACTEGSECLLVCDPGDPMCGFSECSGGSGVQACGDGVIACNRPCPQ